MYIYIYLYIYMYICLYICIYVYIYVYIFAYDHILVAERVLKERQTPRADVPDGRVAVLGQARAVRREHARSVLY